jgi:DNA-directed RNA polymerase specialized sigma24 family protein
MEHLRKLGLLDGDGNPFGAHIEDVLSRLLPRLRREFPALQDEVAQVEVLEEAGRRLVLREERTGPLEKINGYAWVTIRSIAMSRLRQGPGRLLQRTLAADASEAVLTRVAALDGSAEQIERSILLREVLATLTPDEQRVCLSKFMGFSSEEIATRRNSTVNAVNLVFFKAKEKIRRTIGVQHSEPNQTAPADEPRVRAAGPHPLAPLSDHPDDETEPTS